MQDADTSIMLQGPEVEPVSGRKARHLVIFLHGLGADGNDLISLSKEFSEALPDAHFISPNAPFSCDMSPFGYQWFSLREWTQDNMLEGARNVTPILNSFVDTTLERLGLSDNNMAFVGFSQGTMLSLFAALRRKKKCAGVVGYSGAVLDNVKTASEIISKPETCLVHGMMDAVVPYISMESAVRNLEAFDVPVEYHTRPLLGHSIDKEGIEIAKKFLRRVLL